MVQKQVQEQAELNPEKVDDEFSTVTFNNAKLFYMIISSSKIAFLLPSDKFAR